MALSSIKERIMKLESEGKFPDPTPNRPSSLDTLDRKSLLKLWEEDEKIFGGRTQEELEFYSENGFFSEQRGRLH
jgi:hypothetical protein